MHKKIKLFVSMLAAAAMLVLLPGGNSLTANAEEANTYSIKYIGGDINDWRYVAGSTFEDGVYHREIYVLKTELLKDGDQVVIYPGDDFPSNKGLDLSGFKLGSLTIYQNTRTVIHVDSIKDCYVLAGASAAINGEVTNAHLYDNTTCTFNSNVLDMVLHINGEPHSNISCAGTVGMFEILEDNTNNTKGTFYDIPKNTMIYKDGTIQFPNWSYQPTETYLQAKAAADGTTASETPADTSASTAPSAGGSASITPAAGASADEYDSVPRTGDSSRTGWVIGLIGIAAVLFTGSYALYRKAN